MKTDGHNVYKGESEKRLPKLPARCANLVIADPPYNQGMLYADYDDKREPQAYWDWTIQWLMEAYRVLDRHGSMWVFCPDEWVAQTKMFCEGKNGQGFKLCGLDMHLRNWIIWTYTFGQNAKKRFTRSHTHILYFTKSKTKFTINPEAVKVPSARQLKYNDKRAVKGGKMPDDTWALLKADIEALLDPVGDVWSQSRICGNYKERVDVSPNQIPVPLMERIILSTSNPGDLVIDPFCGTGSSGKAARFHGRRYLGIDKAAACVTATKKALAEGQQRREAADRARIEQPDLFD